MLAVLLRHYFSSCHHLLLPTAESMNATVRTGESRSVCVQKAVQAYAQQTIIITKESVCEVAGCCYADDGLDEDA